MLLGFVALFFVAVELFAVSAILLVPYLQILTLSLLILLQLAEITMLILCLAKQKMESPLSITIHLLIPIQLILELIVNTTIVMVIITANEESLEKKKKAK